MTDRLVDLIAGERPLRWLFTGDSVTHGALHTFGNRDYVQLFEERIRWELGRRRDHVIRTGVSERTIIDLEEDLDWSVAQYRPDIVSLMFGLNDCAVAEPDVRAFSLSYRRVVDALLDGGARVVVHTPNRILVTETEERRSNLPMYVDAIRRLASDTDVLLVDHYQAWGSQDETNVEHWIARGCHPNSAGHRALCRALLLELGLWDPSSTTGRFFIPGTDPT